MPEGYQDFSQFLTNNARSSLEQADILARSLGSPYIGTEHLLLGVLSQSDSVGAQILAEAGVTFDKARTALNLTPRTLVISTGQKGLSETAKLTLRMSWEVAQEFRQDICGTEHILFSLLSQKNARATVLLRDMNISVDDLLAELENYLARQHADADEVSEATTSRTQRSRSRTALDKFGQDITAAARRGELDPVIGREKQISRMITILSRRTKNNPILIGEPGVGKTAIVEGLAARIVAEDVPSHLLDKRIVLLDIPGLIAGTKYRGEFEQRLKSVMDEVSSDPNIILFVDELHLIVGTGAAEGSMDAANILKPGLARGKIRMIGATTLDEYRKHIEKDAAFERRLQPIVVPEPSSSDTRAILKGLKPHYEKHHGVSVSDEIIDEVVYMAERYINDRFMPDKALDVLDEAAALLRVKHAKAPTKLRAYMKELRTLGDKMDDAVANEDYERAALYKMRMTRLQEKIDHSGTKNTKTVALDSTTVARAVSEMSGVPVMQLKKTEAGAYRKLEGILAKQIVGQQDALKVVAKAIRRSRSGIGSGKRPIGSFIFMGPTGVGKTELARVLAREVFGSEKALVKIDMSEFSERHTASRLLGAPAGYVGYEDGGQLTDKIRRQPYSVVLFDEIEKAHRDVFQLLLQILEDGVVSDAKGRQIDFSNTIIILTSNLGAERMQREVSLGFAAKSQRETEDLVEARKETEMVAREALAGLMRPELIARFDDIVVFHALTKTEVSKIFDLLVDDVRTRLQRKGFGLMIEPRAKRWLVEKGYDEKNGVRPLRRVIQDEVEHAIAEGLLEERWKTGDILLIRLRRGVIEIGVTHETATISPTK
ncbi:MAG TPA: ATP-dependent Clp protease ATP-binding subunit [Candidatus Saccharibacteria bacterium]|nr:ATP-dependent Clp protease ATP-binding subunit [Candidatus Saccharibacteria bacterium]